MRKCIGLLIPLLLAACAFGQTTVRDSLLHAFGEAKNDSLKYELLDQAVRNAKKENFDSAAHYAQRLIDFSEKNIPKKLPDAYLTLGDILSENYRIEKALEAFYKAKELAVSNQRKDLIPSVFLYISNAENNRNAFEESIKFAHRALPLFIENRDSFGLMKTYNSLGSNYNNMEGQADSALFYYQKTLEVSTALGNDYYQMRILNNLGTYYHMSEKNYPKAIEYYNRGYEIAKKLDNKGAMVFLLMNPGHAYISMEMPDSAVNYLLPAYELAKKTGQNMGIASSAMGLYKSYALKGDYQKAFEYQSISNEKSNEIVEERYNDQVAEMKTKYETTEKENQLAQQELTIARQENRQKVLFFGSLAAILLLIGGFQYFRTRQRAKQQATEFALQLEKAEADQLRELDQLKSNFFANISHEFRTPLTLMLGPLREMKNGSFTGDAQKYFGIMTRQGERLLGLVNQLLDLSRLESGEMKLHLERGDVAAFLRPLVFSFESLADRRQIDFRTHFPDVETTLPFDRDKLSKIVTNLLSNAFKFTPEEGRVSVDISRKGEELEIKIADTGIGIPAKELPHVFERFFQTENSESDVQAGTGVGLALVKELTELHKGKIHVESTEGKGTTFTVTLPMSEAAYAGIEIFENKNENENLNEKSQEINKPATATATAKFSPLTSHSSPLILVVEDNPDVRTYVIDTLKNDYQIIEAENGAAGLETAFEKMPDLIVSDVMMPKMDGNQLCKKLKTDARTSHIPVVLLTAKAGQEAKIEGLETGADDYLTKPFDAAELKVRVKNLIEQRRRLRESFRGSAVLKPKEIAVTSADEDFLNRVMEAIEENMDDDTFSIENMGREVGMSRSQLHRKIKALTDKSPSVFLRTMRLQRAKDLLEKGAGNATEVAYRTGFSNAAYFSKTFKDLFGVSPSEVRKQ